MLPLLAIVLIYVRTLGSRKFSEGEGRVLKLVSGLMMLGLGSVLVAAPEYLSRPEVAGGFVLIAVLVGVPAWRRERKAGPLDFIARLAALVPKPRVNLTRFHGVFEPNSKYRARVTPAGRGRGGQRAAPVDPEEPTPVERRAAMTWAQRLKRVFGIDIETCPGCGGAVRIIACIEDAEIIGKILIQLDAKITASEATRRPPCQAPLGGHWRV